MKSNRRKLLKAMTLGGGAATISNLPAVWSKPVLEAVMLPAHAQTSGPCVLEVNLTLELAGDYEGSGGFSVYDSSTCYYNHGDTGAFDVTITFSQLGPGTYYVAGGAGFSAVGGTSGSGSVTFRVSCCSEAAHGHDSGTGGEAGGIPISLMVVIGDDGTCSIRSPEAMPASPCA